MFCTFPFSDSERRAHFQQFKVQSRRPERPEAAGQETGGDWGSAAGGDIHWELRLRLRHRLTHRHQRHRHRVSSSVQLCPKIFLWEISRKDSFWSDCKMIWTLIIFSKRWNFSSLVCWLLASSLGSSGSAARSPTPGNYPPMRAEYCECWPMTGRVPGCPAPLPPPSAGPALWASLRMMSVRSQERGAPAPAKPASAASMAASMSVCQVTESKRRGDKSTWWYFLFRSSILSSKCLFLAREGFCCFK